MSQQTLINEFKILETGSNFMSKQIKEFAQKYPKKFVAIKDNQLIAISESFEEIMTKIKEKGFNPNSVLIEYIPGKEEIILY
jgi:hypothetical protein